MREEETVWRGMAAVKLTGGGYEAVIIPAFGANCVSLRHLPTGTDILRSPADEQALAGGVNVYGLPLLFPPNRVRDGRFTFGGREYVFPVNEPARGNHIHGMLSSAPFTRVKAGPEDRAHVSFAYRATDAAPYLAFPHAFTVVRAYALDGRGLAASVTFRNDSAETMPFGTGVHAALALRSDAAYTLRVPALRHWPVDPVRMLTRGDTVSDGCVLDPLRAGVDPVNGPLSIQLECEPGAPIVLSDGKTRVTCVYDEKMPFVMLWNGGGRSGFVCPEPETCAADAANLPNAAAAGWSSLAPGEERTFTLRFSAGRGA